LMKYAIQSDPTKNQAERETTRSGSVPMASFIIRFLFMIRA